jgi:5'-methylthioadenosine nucleosidase
MRIVILMAMLGEAQPLITKLGMEKAPEGLPLLTAEVYFKNINGAEIFLVTNGTCSTFNVDQIGTQPAAVTTYAAILTLRPDLILNAGTAGGFQRKGGDIGQVYVATEVKYHDRRIPLGNFEAYGVGAHKCINIDELVKDLSLKRGVVCTSNALDATPEDHRLMSEFDASLKEMEAAAIAGVAKNADVPFLAIKSITDLVDHPADAAEQFLANFDLAVRNLAEMMDIVVRRLAPLEASEFLVASSRVDDIIEVA